MDFERLTDKDAKQLRVLWARMKDSDAGSLTDRELLLLMSAPEYILDGLKADYDRGTSPYRTTPPSLPGAHQDGEPVRY